MPVTIKNQRNIHYRARLDGLTAQECLALIDQIAATFELPVLSSAISFDLPSKTFQGTLDEAREAFPSGGVSELINSANLGFAGQRESRDFAITVAASPIAALVSITVGPLEPGELDALIALVKQALPPIFADADAEQQRLREVRIACEELVADAAAAKSAAVACKEHTQTVVRLGAEIEAANVAVAAQLERATSTVEGIVEHSAAITKIHLESDEIKQEIADKKLALTAMVNNAADFQRRIEESEQKARTTVEDVQARATVTLSEIQTKSWTTIAELGTGNAALVSRLQGTNDTALAEMRDVMTRDLKEYSNRTGTIVKQNQVLQSEVKTLLQGATAGGLHLAFKERQQELERTQDWWLAGLVVNTVCVVGAAMWLINDLASVEGSELGLMAIKVTVVLPLAILDVFIASQYTHRRALIEEYAFKASICASLMPFKDLVSGQAAEASTQRFVLDAVERIYANPSDAISRAGPATRQIKRAMKTLQDTGVLDLAKSVAEKAKP